MVAFRQNRQLAASSFYDRPNAGNGMKSELHPVCSTAACSLHPFPMNILSRAFAFCCLIAASLVSITAVSAQDLFAAANPSPGGPDTTRLLRFPTTNGTQIVFCYAGELYTVGKDGGTARRLTSGPGYTSFARFSPDGTQIAFTSHYDGNTEVYVMPAEGGTPKRLTTKPAQDICPMLGPDNRVYFISDRDNRMNLFAVDLATKETKQLTHFTDFDIKFPSLGKDSIVFEQAGYIWRYDLATGQAAPVPIAIKEDFDSGHGGLVDASKHLESVNLAPDGERTIVVARGHLFSVPAKNGTTRNLSKTSGAHERDAVWSPEIGRA